jgi:hypothetical protein
MAAAALGYSAAVVQAALMASEGPPAGEAAAAAAAVAEAGLLRLALGFACVVFFDCASVLYSQCLFFFGGASLLTVTGQ